MDIYTNPAKNTYVTDITKFFLMPTDSGGIPAVAVTKRASVYISSAYTILMILIFMIGWNLILAIIMAFWPTHGDPNRQTALVALWNSGESMNAMTLMVYYCEKVILHMLGRDTKKKKASKDVENKTSNPYHAVDQDPNTDSNNANLPIKNIPPGQEKPNETPEASSASKAKCGVSNLLWGLLFGFIALAMTVGNVATGIFVPVQLSMGNVVPPAKDVIFYPDVSLYQLKDDNGAGAAKLNSLFAPSALRALGSIEASKVTVRERVNVDVETNNGSSHAIYSYTVTGVDMGLQTDPKLQLKVRGECNTDDTSPPNSTDKQDTYSLFGGKTSITVNYQPEVDFPPMVNFAIDEDTGGPPNSNTSYALVVSTGGLYSYTAGQDPWYVTDKSGPNVNVAYQVRRGRPVLSCWEVSRWHLNGKDVDISELDKLPGLKLDRLWRDTVFQIEFGAPRVVRVGRYAGTSALKSASYAVGPSYILDAGASTIKDDLERLVLASWVSSRNVLRDTTTYDKGTMQGVAETPGGSVEAAAAKFVLQSGDVETLSVRILIAIPVILLVLLIVEKILVCALRHAKKFGQKPIFGEEKNGVALQATQLFRGLDKKIHSLNKWEHEKGLIPFLYPPKSPGADTETPADPKAMATVALKSLDAQGQ